MTSAHLHGFRGLRLDRRRPGVASGDTLASRERKKRALRARGGLRIGRAVQGLVNPEMAAVGHVHMRVRSNAGNWKVSPWATPG